MKRLGNLIFVIVIIAGITGCCAQYRFDRDKEIAKISTVLEKYVIANEIQDLDALKGIWGPGEDILIIGTAMDEIITGWNTLEEALQKQFEVFENTYIAVTDQIININETGNTAWYSEVFNYNFIYKGKAVSYEGIRCTGVLNKIDGEWRIVQAHMSVPQDDKYE